MKLVRNFGFLAALYAIAPLCGQAQTIYPISSNLNKINVLPYAAGTYNATLDSGYWYEFTANCTDLKVQTYINAGFAALISVDGAAATTLPPATTYGNTTLPLATGLAADNHLFRINFTGSSSAVIPSAFILTGGTETFTGQAKTAADIFTQSNWETNPNVSIKGVGPYCEFPGATFEFNYTGTAFEMATSNDGGGKNGYVSLDNGNYKAGPVATALIPSSVCLYFPTGPVQSPGSHTARVVDTGPYTTRMFYFAVRILNGSALASPAASGDNSLTVASNSNTQAWNTGDWLAIDAETNHEYRKIATVISAGPTTTVTFDTGLTKNHAAGVSVTNFNDAPGSISRRTDPNAVGRAGKKLVAIGDSITVGYDGSKDGMANIAGDPLNSYAWRAANALGWDVVDLAQQGTTVAEMLNRPGTASNRAASADAVVILAGTNNVNSDHNGEKLDQFSTDYATLIHNCRVAYPSAPIFCSLIFTPGIFPTALSSYNARVQAAVAMADSNVYLIDLSAGLNLTIGADLADFLHPSPSGQAKMAANLQAYLDPMRTTVTGRIALEGVNDLSATSPGAPLGTFHVSFRNPGTTTEVYGADVMLTPVGAGNPSGMFSISGIPAGTYDVAIKGSKSLRVVVGTVTVGSGTLALPDVTLPAGDANNDNYADIGDFGVLFSAYAATYDPNDPSTGYDPAADFNYDGVVNSGDFGLLVNEFSLDGAP